MKRIMGSTSIALCSLMLVFQSVSFPLQSEPGAKALFYNPESGATLTPLEKKKNPDTGTLRVRRVQPAQVKYSGLHYWIELDGAGPVTTDRVFRTGDRIRVHVRSNVDGYLSLWWLDASGTGKLLFPVPGSGSDNYVKADTDYKTPGSIKFSLPAEDERLLVFFSRFKTDMPNNDGKSTSSDIVARARDAAGSKALVFETESVSPAEVGHYVVNKNGGAVIKEILLKHR